jgi:hypothetical protein
MSDNSLTARLAEAKTALHELQTGRMARVVVDQNGERVEFNMTSADRLRAYVSDLEAQVAAGAVPRSRGPLRFLF